MKQIDFNRFDFQSIQMGISFCIPACAFLMFKYHDHSFQYSQEYILSLMVSKSPDHQPSFNAMVNYVQPEFKNYSITKLDPTNYSEWANNIKKEIDDNSPIAIATRGSSNGVHIRLVIGYDDQNSEFFLFNPGVFTLSPNLANQQIYPGLYLTLRSYVEKYKYLDAENDFNSPLSTKDQLIIKPV